MRSTFSRFGPDLNGLFAAYEREVRRVAADRRRWIDQAVVRGCLSGTVSCPLGCDSDSDATVAGVPRPLI
jgi:hypothetical protein